MDISVEISKYPLTEDYLNQVDDFLYRLHAHKEIQVETNNISTQVFGKSEDVFRILEKEISQSFATGQCPFVLKVLKGNLSDKPIKAYK